MIISSLYSLSIRGVVRDSRTGLPISDVNICATGYHAVSNNNGSFKIEGVIPGNYRLEFSHIAYLKNETVVNIQSEDMSQLVIYLEPLVFNGQTVTIERERERDYLVIDPDLPQKPLEYYIEKLPGVVVIGEEQNIRFSIRGSRPEDVLIVFDGFVIPRNENGLCDIKHIESNNIASIELLKDNIPARFSAESPAGVIIINSKEHTRDIAIIETAAGSWGRSNLSLNYNMKLQSGLNMKFSSSCRYALMDFPYIVAESLSTRENNYYRNGSIGFNLKKSWEKAEIDAILSYLDFHQGMPGDLNHPTPKAETEGRKFSINARGLVDLPNNFKAKIDYSLFLHKADYFSPRPYVYVPIDSRHRVQSQRMNIDIQRKYDFIFPKMGFGYWPQSYNLQNNLNSDMNIDDKTRENLNIWFEAPINIDPISSFTFTIYPGFRYDWIDSLECMFNHSIEGKFSYTKFGQKVGVSGGHSTAYKLPDFTDLYWQRDAYAEGNPDLAPEDIEKKHLGFFCVLTWKEINLSFGSDFYLRKIDSVIVWNRGFDGLYRPMNFNREETRGRDDYLSLSFDDKIDIEWTNTLLAPIHRSPDKTVDSLWLPFRPEYHQSLNIRFNHSDFYHNIGARSVGRRYILLANTKWLEQYSVLDYSLGYSRDFPRFVLSSELNLKNILDNKYEIMDGYPMPGRNMEIEIRIQWKI